MAVAQSLHYDAVIIGAGIGGLTAAALLSKSGLKVAVLEKEPRIGGYLAGFQRKGFKFDTAIHWLNQCSATGIVSRVFDLIGKDHPTFAPRKFIQRYKSESIDYVLTNNPDEFRDKLIEQYPEDRNGINRFFRHAKKIGKSFDNYKSVTISSEIMSSAERAKNIMQQLRFALPFIPFISYSGKKMKKGLLRFFKNEKIHSIFSAESDLLSCLVPIGWAYYNDYQLPPDGGGQMIPDWLKHVIKSYGNNIFVNTTVSKIMVKEGKVQGVDASRKGTPVHFTASHVIAACDLNLVYTKLLEPGLISPTKIRKLKDAEIYASSFTISIALNCCPSLLGFGSEMVHLFKDGIDKELHNSGDPEFSALSILAPSVTDESMVPQGKGTVVVFMPAYMHQYNQWETEADGSRGTAYQNLKEKIAVQLIDRVEKAYPGFKEQILFFEAATPVTHWRYTGNTNGTMMGTKPCKTNMQSKVAQYKTPVKNLIIGGHWAELGGGVPIAVKAGTNAALLVLQKANPEAYKEIVAFLKQKKTLNSAISHSAFKAYAENWIPNTRGLKVDNPLA